ncbi:MAG: TIGR02281 family clan AA aspartic protease [Gammaproteobacteria bacterium]|nr:MAG: TIGR02281 family clan AA aspartic protease [Gammaproteobacteria bacterium]
MALIVVMSVSEFNRAVATIFLLILLVLANNVMADEPRIEVVGLFKDRAVIVVDGKRYFVKKGKTISGNIKLLSSTNQEVVLEVNGKEQRLKLGGRIGGFLKKPADKEVVIWKSSYGMFLTVGSINGFPVNFLVDTGATKVALNRRDAEHYGVVIDERLRRVMVSTASGYAPAFLVKLNKVRVGSITLRGVDAIVMEGNHPKKVLLGMSFLNRVNFNQKGQSLMLTSK